MIHQVGFWWYLTLVCQCSLFGVNRYLFMSLQEYYHTTVLSYLVNLCGRGLEAALPVPWCFSSRVIYRSRWIFAPSSQGAGNSRFNKRKENLGGQLFTLGEQECKACARVGKWPQKEPRGPQPSVSADSVSTTHAGSVGWGGAVTELAMSWRNTPN